MSSPRKRAAIRKANDEAAQLRQRLAIAEPHAAMLREIAERHALRADDLYAALAELVALESMKDELSLMLLREEGGMGAEYDRRKPLAWARARELVGERK